LPYNPASASRGIEVSAITVRLEVSPSPPWRAGQTLTFTATVLKDSEPYPDALVYFLWGNRDTGDASFTSKRTGADGKATVTWTIPWKWTGRAGTSTVPCKFNWAYATFSAYRSNTVTGNVAYPTRISISAPSRVDPNAAFTISGKLEYEGDEGVWRGLAGRTVTLYYDTTKIADVTTGSDGSYSKPDARIPSPGTYTLKAVFAGEGLGLAPAAAGARLVVPEAVKPLIAPLAAMVVGGLAVALTAKR